MTNRTMANDDGTIYDLAIIGGGVNGCGIARDAAGRGLSVLLCEQGDLAQGTSSASTKLFHGGLRYLEHWEFRLVREALIEREVLLRAMPHISWPMRFVLPQSPRAASGMADPFGPLYLRSPGRAPVVAGNKHLGSDTQRGRAPAQRQSQARV